MNFAGTIDADNTYNLRVWGATYMSLGSKLFHMADNEWFNDRDDDSRLVSLICHPIFVTENNFYFQKMSKGPRFVSSKPDSRFFSQ